MRLFHEVKALFLLVFLLQFNALSAQAFTDSNLPIVVINTDIDPNTNQPYEIPDDPRVLATMKIVKHPDGSRNYLADQANASLLDYNGRISIEIRGSSSQMLPKKPYGLTTLAADDQSNNNVSLLGMPSENDWVLNALAFDPSLMRDYLSYYLARQIGDYAPRTQYCEVVLNGQYIGLYMLQEKIKADSNRVNIVKITASDNAGANLTGGYITKADKTTGGDPVAWSMSSYDGVAEFIHDLPKPENVTTQQNNYIHAQFTSLATAAANDNLSAVSGIPAKIDVPTFVDFMIMAEISSNADAYQLSTYFHKDRGGKLRAGPIWDYNLTFGNDLFAFGLDRSHYNVWQFANGDNTGAKFWKDLFDNPTFKCYFSRRWNQLTSPGQPLKHNNLVTLIDATVALIAEATVRENQKWGTIPDHANEIANLKNWLYQRINWMTANIGPYAACSNVDVPRLVINKINYNPSASGSFPVSNDQEFIEIKNAGNALADLTGVYFSELGISYQFPSTTLAAGQSVYIASNSSTFQMRYGFAPLGQFARNLSNKSQKLVLADAFGNVIDLVEYKDNSPWPDADGNGSYLQLIDTSLDNSLASSWTASGAMLAAQDVTLDSTSLYPNPVRDTLHVRLQKTINKVQLFDPKGKLLKTQTAHAESIDLDMAGLAQGVYYVLISFDGGSSSRKIVKQ